MMQVNDSYCFFLYFYRNKRYQAMKLTALEYLVAAVSALNKSIYQPINSAESLDAAVAQKAQFIAYRCQAHVV